MKRLSSLTVASVVFLLLGALPGKADEKPFVGSNTTDVNAAKETKAQAKKAEEKAEIHKDQDEAIWVANQTGSVGSDSAWMLVATALVMLMTPGLALFYGGMARRKNLLGTMMHSMVALAVVGVFWFVIGYALAFGDPWITLSSGKGILGFNSDLICLLGVWPTDLLPGTSIPVYLHMMYQGMFAIITPALISGAVAERIRFKPYCVFLVLWITFVYCPLAHMVWAMDWNWATTLPMQHVQFDKIDLARLNAYGHENAGWLGAMGVLDFAGGIVVHISAGFSGLAAILVLRKRIGYPEKAIRPNSIVLVLIGAGLLWFGWFGFNGGSGLRSGRLAVSAFTATQVAGATAALAWILAEWFHRGKPTALGLASGLVAGLATVTPASGFVLPFGGFIIGLLAGVICYISVSLKPRLRYDDSLDAFGVHGVGGFCGTILTGFFCCQLVPLNETNGLFYGNPMQVAIQLLGAGVAAGGSFALTLVLVNLVQKAMGFTSSVSEELEGLDHSEHGEIGFDFGLGIEEASVEASVPRAALAPPVQKGRFEVILEGPPSDDLLHAWSKLCQPSEKIPPAFNAVYPYITTVQGNRFQFRGGNPNLMRDNLQELLQQTLGKQVQARVQVRNGAN